MYKGDVGSFSSEESMSFLGFCLIFHHYRVYGTEPVAFLHRGGAPARADMLRRAKLDFMFAASAGFPTIIH
jgi:hypothetical protein